MEVYGNAGDRHSERQKLSPTPGKMDAAIKRKCQALKSADGLLLTGAAFMFRLHPKPADADQPMV
jgi:hypothetical protein